VSVVKVRRELDRHGLLLVTDPVLPSVAGIVAREPVQGSWWSHPASHAIFAVLEGLDDADDMLLVKLVSGKQTFVAATLWRDFFSVATAKKRWQTQGLSPEDRSLLRRIESGESVRAAKGSNALETRLLAYGANVHTESGAHAKMLTSWKVCMHELHFRLRPKDPEASKTPFEERLDSWTSEFGKKATLPWQKRGNRH
jgi:hypothetical protein